MILYSWTLSLHNQQVQLMQLLHHRSSQTWTLKESAEMAVKQKLLQIPTTSSRKLHNSVKESIQDSPKADHEVEAIRITGPLSNRWKSNLREEYKYAWSIKLTKARTWLFPLKMSQLWREVRVKDSHDREICSRAHHQRRDSKKMMIPSLLTERLKWNQWKTNYTKSWVQATKSKAIRNQITCKGWNHRMRTPIPSRTSCRRVTTAAVDRSKTSSRSIIQDH